MIVISCCTDVFAGVALMYEPPERDIMLEKPRDVRRVPLVPLSLIAYSYLFFGTLQSIASFGLFFQYLSSRGPHTLPSPLPDTSSTALTPLELLPAGYSPGQLVFAWHWAAGGGPLTADETSALNTGSSIFFLTLVVTQMGHLLSMRRKDSPYFTDLVMPVGGGVLDRAFAIASYLRPPSNVLFAWIGEVCIVLLFTEPPVLQQWCGTAHIPALYWCVGGGP